MKETKLPEGCIDNSVSASDSGKSFATPDHVTRLDCEKPEESLEKMFAFNRGAYSSPLEPDANEEAPKDELMDMEEAAKCEPDEDEDGKQ